MKRASLPIFFNKYCQCTTDQGELDMWDVQHTWGDDKFRQNFSCET